MTTTDRYFYDWRLERDVMTALQQQTPETFPPASPYVEHHMYYLSKSLGTDDAHGALIVKASQKQFGKFMYLTDNRKYSSEKAILEYAFNRITGQWEIRAAENIKMKIQKSRPRELVRIGKPRYTKIYYLAVFPSLEFGLYDLAEAYHKSYMTAKGLLIDTRLAFTLVIADLYE